MDNPAFQAYGLIGRQKMPTNNYNIMKVIYFIRGQSIKATEKMYYSHLIGLIKLWP